MMNNNYIASFRTSQAEKEVKIIATTINAHQKRASAWFSGFLILMLWFCANLAFAQQEVQISGVVSDKKGETLPGISVYIKGTVNGTTTDVDGKYTLKAPSDATIVFEGVELTKQEIAVNNQTSINVTMLEDVKELTQVVIVGYGTQQKKDVTGSIATLDSGSFNQGPITNPLQQINGRVAGVTINQVGSEPGTAPNIRIRGIASLAGSSDPLFVIDGIQGGSELYNAINPSEIETFDILKDASATAIYGARGAAGVVIITTKKGQEGKTTMEYSGTISFDVIAKKYDMLSAEQWRAEATRRGIASSADFGGNTDWFKQITRNGLTQNHNLAFGGGTKNFTYRASAGAILQDGIILNSNSKTFMGRFMATQKALNNRLTLTYNLNASIGQNNFNNGEVVGLALSRRPTDPVYFPNGNYFTTVDVFDYTNPLARTKEILNGNKTNSYFASMKADYEIMEGLTASVFGSWRKRDEFYGRYDSRLTTQQFAINQKGVASRNTNIADEKIFNFILNYNKVVGDHSFGATAVYEWQKQDYEGFGASARGFINDLLTMNALQSGSIADVRQGDVFSYRNDRTLVSVLGRLNYAYQGKYLATVNFRRDGSSLFGKNNRWANFPSVSLAWRVSEEAFLKDNKIVSNLKVRAGYGVTGSLAGIGPQNSLRLVNPSGTAFFQGGQIPNFAISQNVNADLRWETREMVNFGVDFGLLDNKLTGTLDYFVGNSKNLLFNYEVPSPPYPNTSILANVGSVRNAGIEATLRYTLVDTKDLTVSLGGNFTYMTNKVTELSGSLNGVPLNTDYVQWGSSSTTGQSSNNGVSYLIKGQQIGTFYLFKHAGVDDQGNQIIDDLNGNGVVDDGNRKNADRYIAGQALPKFTWGFTPSVRYKDFDLSLVLRGAGGHHVYNSRRSTLSAMSQMGQANVLADAPNNNIKQITYASNFWLERGDFARLENLTIGWNVKKVGAYMSNYVQSVRVSFTANNLFVLTGYKGIDPEQSVSGGNGFGIDNGIYPRVRSFAFGLQVSFK